MMKELEAKDFMETSALTGQNIEPLFEKLTKHIYMSNMDKLDEFKEETGMASDNGMRSSGVRSKNIDLYKPIQPKNEKKKGCKC